MMPVSWIFIVIIYLMLPSALAAQDTTVDPVNRSSIRVILDQIYISTKDDYLDVSEIVVFRNEGPGVFYEPENHTYFAVSIPDGIENLETNAMECCLVRHEDAVYMDPMEPVNPGDNFEMKISYRLFPGNRDYMFKKIALYNTTSLSVFVNKGKTGTGEGVGTVTIHGDEFEVVSFENLTEGKEIVIPLQVDGKTELYTTAGVIIVFLLAVISGLKFMAFRKGKNESLEKLEQEKLRIFRTIHGFEKHAGNEESEEYRKLMDEYRQKGIRVIIKIDKIKSKESESDGGRTGRVYYNFIDKIRRKK